MSKGNKRTIYLGLDYTDFTGGVSEINRKMGLLDAEFKLAQEQAKNYGNETDQLGIKQDYLKQKIELQTKKVEAAKKAYDEAMKSQKASGKEIDALDKKLLQERTALERLNGQLSEGNKKTESFGDEIRRLATDLGLKVSPALENLASKFDGISKETGNAMVLIGGIVSTLSSFAIEAAHTADDLLTLSSVTGLSTDELQKFQYASSFVDVSVETMSGSLKKLTQTMYNAKTGNKEATEAFRKLHVSIKDSTGQMKDSNEMFYEVIDALGKIKNETERDALAMKVFGKSATELNPLIEAGSQRLKELGIEAENMGVVMGEESIQKLGKLQDAMDKFDATSESLKNNLALTLLPILTKLFEVIGSIPVPVLKTIVTIATVVATIMTVVKAIMTVVKAIKSMTDTASGITKFFKGFDTSALKTTAIVLGIVAALIALATVIAVIIGKSGELDRSMQNMSTSIGKVTSSVNQAQNGAYQTASHASSTTNFRAREHKEGVYSTSLNASGTENFRGGRTWVGEAGPELLTLPRGTRIDSTEESMGKTVNYYNITMNVREMKEFIEMQEYFSRRQLEERRA